MEVKLPSTTKTMDNSCAGSLTYSASSSARSAESSNDSSFSNILKLIDSEGEGASEIKDFIAKKKAASGSGHAVTGGFMAAGGGQYESYREVNNKDAAVQAYMQRKAAHQREQQVVAKQQMQSAQQSSHKLNFKKNPQNSMMPTTQPVNTNVDLNYSKRDIERDNGYGVEKNVYLETIAG